MKRFTISLLLFLCLGRWASAAPDRIYQNYGDVIQQTNIDAVIFANYGNFDLGGITVIGNTVLVTTGALEGFPFDTTDTLYYTNTGTMFAEPGFLFNTSTAKGRHPAASFYNSGAINNLDTPPVYFVALLAGGGIVLEPNTVVSVGINQLVPSVLQVSATNITNPGTLTVGDYGVMTISGQNVSLADGALVSGTASDTDTNSLSGRGVMVGFISGKNVYPAFTAPTGVYDLYWGLTNSEALSLPNLTAVAQYLLATQTPGPVTPGELVTNRVGATTSYPLPESTYWSGVTSDFAAYVYQSDVITDPNTGVITNVYYNIVLVKTNFPDANITATVGFLPSFDTVGLVTDDPNGIEAVVQFSAPIQDVITGQMVSNSVYLLDTGAGALPVLFAQNTAYSAAFGKPDCFEITTTTPGEWLLTTPANYNFNPTLIYGFDAFGARLYQSNTVSSTNASYAVQVNSNPERTDGLFPLTISMLGSIGLNIPTLTNGISRVEVSAKNLDVSNVRIRANGTITIHATNYTGVPSGTDWDSVNSDLGNLHTNTIISNLFPHQFRRLRGDILAYATDWLNVQTNDGNGNPITNTEHVHLLVVDQTLQSSFKSSVLNLALRGSNVVENDDMVVLQSSLFQATNVTFNGNVHFSEGAANLEPNNLPVLKNLLVTTNGTLAADNQIYIGVPITSTPGDPSKRTYSVNTITNYGFIGAAGVVLQPLTFANGGTVLCSNSGAMLLNAKTNLLGAGLGIANSLIADGDINLSSISIQASNSTIRAGLQGNGRLNLYATNQLTDFLTNSPSTNAYVTNLWQVSAGFSLTTKPLNGDLFATEIKSVAAKFKQVSLHVWAGADRGPTLRGFSNNMVIGHLLLDREDPTAGMRFSPVAVGKTNALYVDYLELANYSYSDYHNGIQIDPNFTIYFANANVDPSKLHQAFPNIVWVPQFAGPNSSAYIPYKGGSNTYINAALKNSSTIDTDLDGTPNSADPFPLDNPILGPVPSPATATSVVLSVTNGGVLAIWAVGQGTNFLSTNGGRKYTALTNSAPIGLTAGQIVTLNAVSNAGWTFVNWTEGTISGPVVVSSVPVFNFTIPATNYFLMANFVPSPFPSLAGVYNGLFYQTNVVTANSSGFVTFTVTTNGTFTGSLLIGSNKYSFGSRFYGTGLATVQATSKTNSLTVTLQLDATGLSDQATGDVSNGTWDAILMADRVPLWTAKNPATQAGQYTFVLPGNADAANSPGGDSYGTITVDKLGNLKAIGTLADNVSFSQSVPLSKYGIWPLYFAPGGVPQTLLGWVTFNTNPPVGFGGPVNWIKAAGKGTYYTNGFITNSVLLGSLYVVPAHQTSGLSLTNPTITLSGGNLAQPLTNNVILSGKVTYQTTNKPQTTLTIAPATGLFTGQYQYLSAGKTQKVPLAGVVLQNQNTAQGFFLGTNQSGAVLLQGD
jgi:hypothetical protein